VTAPGSRARLRIGAVSYLNTKPLVHDLARLAPEADVVYDLPSRLADDLATGGLDVALIPSVELFRGARYTIVSDACIACRGPVLSVKVLARVPLPRVRTLALDEGSRTSAALTRILLRERFGLEPELRPFPIGARPEDVDADAVLVIGDRAIPRPPRPFAETWDLGEEWCRWAGLPFVFAVWTAREHADLADVGVALSAARDLGVTNLEAIAAREASAVGLTADACLAYLRDNLHFRLGPDELRGLTRFHSHAARLGLAPADWRLAPRDLREARG
jgi:chorismate dehydratase